MPLPVAGGPLFRRAIRLVIDGAWTRASFPTTAKEKPRATEVRVGLPWTGWRSIRTKCPSETRNDSHSPKFPSRLSFRGRSETRPRLLGLIFEHESKHLRAPSSLARFASNCLKEVTEDQPG